MVNNLRKTFISGYMIMCSTFVSSDPVRPNIILILADDAVSCKTHTYISWVTHYVHMNFWYLKFG